MQKAELEQQRAAIRLRFDELTKQKDTITQELYRLQGNFDLLGELITNWKEEDESGRKPERAKELTRKS